ncbi:MAG: alpha/beta hydrolase [Zoogloeaceae bacterium]|jgi:pimeloyl-ACP methyl ester carboxylesterase|nr:alpha/beta hydrolase [Zoogloeaceae bacterium]
MSILTLGHRQLEYVRLNARAPAASPLVFLHEGLGSIAMWKSFPERLCEATDRQGFVYSREGYGHSSPRPDPLPLDYLEREAQLVLPALLEKLDIAKPWLVGHSDGGTIALLAAAGFSEKLAGIILIAPHWFVEDVCLAGITRARRAYESGPLKENLQRYHDHPDAVFYGWHDVWTNPARRNWNIADICQKITCPIFALQGEKDEYATLEQIDGIACCAPQTDRCVIPDCGHFPHLRRQEETVAAIAKFPDVIARSVATKQSSNGTG